MMAGTRPEKQSIQPSHVHEPAREVLLEGTLRLLFENSPDATFLINENLFSGCNQAAVDLMHCSNKSELLSHHLSELSPQYQIDGRSSFDKANEMFAQAFSKGSHRCEWMCRRADNSEVPVEILLTAIPVNGNQILYAVFRDISESKGVEAKRSKFENALLSQSVLMTSILENMEDAVIVADAEEKFLAFNPAAERMFGRGVSETGTDKWSQTLGLYLPDEVTPFPPDQLPLTRALRGEATDGIEMFVRHASAPEGLWTRISGRPLSSANGELSGGVIVGRDVTESKKAEAFRAGQGRILEMIATGAPLAEVLTSLVLLIERQSKEMFCSILLLADDGAHVRHGAAPSLPEHYVRAVDGAPIGPKNGSCGTAMYLGKQVIVTDIFSDPLWEDYRDLASASGLRACWSTPIISGRGEVLGSFAMYYGQPRTPSEKEARLTEVATHIARVAIEHQRAEEALLRTQAELAHVSRVTTMGELAASIAHEVNQPLGAIVGNAEICLNWLGDRQPDLEQLNEALEDIRDDGRRASEVIARIRTLVKKNVPDKTSLDFNEIAREVLALVDHEAQRKGITLRAELAAEVPTVHGDRVQLQQVLINLLMNGMDAMAGVERAARDLTLSTIVSEGGKILVAVRDCGVGIDSKQVEQVFKAFHTTKSGGLGMGLAISRSIIEAHGGRLWAEPKQGPGATFKFTLPASVGDDEHDRRGGSSPHRR